MLIIYVVAFIAIFYFMAIRPQQRQRRAHTELLSSLKKGDTIVTAAGMYGTVKKVEENIVEVEVAKGVTVKINRRAVTEIVRDRAEARAVAPTRATRSRKAAAEIEAAEEALEDAAEGTSDDDYAADETYADESAEDDEPRRS